MGFMRRIASGALGGVGGTLALTGFREVLTAAGLVGVSAPEQVIARLEELGLLDDPSPEARRVLTAVAHLSYGVGLGAALGFLRRERGGMAEETAVGTALGLLAWGANWTVLLPSTGVHRPPWKERTPKVLLPILDHAVYGAAWGFLYRAMRSDWV
jgi:tetrahydromethanopterin S-methyltransferase subunit D